MISLLITRLAKCPPTIIAVMATAAFTAANSKVPAMTWKLIYLVINLKIQVSILYKTVNRVDTIEVKYNKGKTDRRLQWEIFTFK